MKRINFKNIQWLLLAVMTFGLVSFADRVLDEHTIRTVRIKHVTHGNQLIPLPESVSNSPDKTAQIPFVDKDFVGFKEALAFKESQGKYNRVNTLGYLGKYQFGRSTLKELNIHVKPKGFLNNPLLQEKAFLANLEKNKWILRKEIKKFNGKWINGIKITESGILAAAHLGGAGAVQQFLWSYGKNTMKDAYGTRIEHYLKKFSGYDLSDIQPKRNPKIDLE